MNRLWIVLGVCLVACTQGAQPAPEDRAAAAVRDTVVPPAGEARRVEIRDSSVGCLRLEAPVRSVRSDCTIVKDTVLYVEGDPQEAMWVDVGGHTALAEIVEGEVWRISVWQPGPMTRDSLQVGSPVNRLAGLPGLQVFSGEGRYFATVAEHCGLSLGLDLPPRRARWEPGDLGSLPDSVAIGMILVVGMCR